MKNKEKMEKIFDAMADMTLEMIQSSREKSSYLSDEKIEMIRTTQSLYETLNYANQPVITSTSMLDVSGE